MKHGQINTGHIFNLSLMVTIYYSNSIYYVLDEIIQKTVKTNIYLMLVQGGYCEKASIKIELLATTLKQLHSGVATNFETVSIETHIPLIEVI